MNLCKAVSYGVCLILLLGCNSNPTKEASRLTERRCNCDMIDPFGKWFMLIAGSAGIMEVEMGKLAVEKSTRKDVKCFAAMMVKEHTDINTEYTRLLGRNCLTPPNVMFPDNQFLYDSLKILPVSAFDSIYINIMIDDHEKAIHLFDEAYQNSSDGEIKTWLLRMKDVVQHHYDMALELKQHPNQLNRFCR